MRGPASRVDRRFDGAVVGLDSRYSAVAADDPLARRRQLRLADLAGRVLAVDPRTGTTTVDLWPDPHPATSDVVGLLAELYRRLPS